MKTIKTQLGVSESADFEENTWTFKMPERYKVAAGLFQIVHVEIFEEMLNIVKNSNPKGMSADLLEEIENRYVK